MPAPIKVLKPVVFLLCLVPLAALIWAIVYRPESFSADPYADITDRTGDWTLRFVLITLAITPLRQISGWNGAVRFRRMLGLFAFFYGFLHFLTYVWFTVVLRPSEDHRRCAETAIHHGGLYRIRPDDSARDHVHEEMDFPARRKTLATCTRRYTSPESWV